MPSRLELLAVTLCLAPAGVCVGLSIFGLLVFSSWVEAICMILLSIAACHMGYSALNASGYTMIGAREEFFLQAIRRAFDNRGIAFFEESCHERGGGLFEELCYRFRMPSEETELEIRVRPAVCRAECRLVSGKDRELLKSIVDSVAEQALLPRKGGKGEGRKS